MQTELRDRLWYYAVAYVLVGIFWRWLEWECFGAPNPNDVDTIIGIITAVSLGENFRRWKGR